ncbi:MAG: GNAT family N-acetyltransferase [Anaerolineae bacterium]|nr:GNAT family N-acetyltransferase [Anaerolineae bacterium]
MTIRTIRYAANDRLPGGEALLAQWNAECFPGHEGNEYTWEWQPHSHFLVWAGGEPVSYLGVFERQALLNGQPLHLGGVGGVMTPVRYRGNGYSTAALRAAADFMRDVLGVPFALLVTGENMIPFYGRVGWQQVAGPLLIDQPGRTDKVTLQAVIMILALAGGSWPEGTIDLCGLPW